MASWSVMHFMRERPNQLEAPHSVAASVKLLQQHQFGGREHVAVHTQLV
jgi:hypothetical protein